MYERMARVLEYTARKHCPRWEVDVREMGDWRAVPHYVEAQDNWLYNTRKLDEWTDEIVLAEEGRLIVFLDADMMVTEPLYPAEKIPFDFAYTTKIPGKTRLPFNGGCVMARATEEGRRMMVAWRDLNRELLLDRPRHMRYRQKYAGMNQASLGALLESPPDGVQIRKLPVLEWNCEDSSWADFGPGTRVVHLKGRMRKAVFGQTAPRPIESELAKRWHAEEAEAKSVRQSQQQGAQT